MNLILQLSNHAEERHMLWRAPLQGLQISMSQSLLNRPGEN